MNNHAHDNKMIEGTTSANLREKERIAKRFAAKAADKAMNMAHANNLQLDPTVNLEHELQALFYASMLDPLQMQNYYSNDDE